MSALDGGVVAASDNGVGEPQAKKARSEADALAAPAETNDALLRAHMCGICHDVLFEPVTTPCGHNFCFECVRVLRKSQPDNNGRCLCPLCRKQMASSLLGSLCVNTGYAEFVVHLAGGEARFSARRAEKNDRLAKKARWTQAIEAFVRAAMPALGAVFVTPMVPRVVLTRLYESIVIHRRPIGYKNQTAASVAFGSAALSLAAAGAARIADSPPTTKKLHKAVDRLVRSNVLFCSESWYGVPIPKNNAGNALCLADEQLAVTRIVFTACRARRTSTLSIYGDCSQLIAQLAAHTAAAMPARWPLAVVGAHPPQGPALQTNERYTLIHDICAALPAQRRAVRCFNFMAPRTTDGENPTMEHCQHCPGNQDAVCSCAHGCLTLIGATRVSLCVSRGAEATIVPRAQLFAPLKL